MSARYYFVKGNGNRHRKTLSKQSLLKKSNNNGIKQISRLKLEEKYT